MSSLRFPSLGSGSWKSSDGSIDAAYVYAAPVDPHTKVTYGQRFAFYLAGLRYHRFTVDLSTPFSMSPRVAIFWSLDVETIQSCIANDDKMAGYRLGAIQEVNFEPVTDGDYIVGLEEEYPDLTGE